MLNITPAVDAQKPATNALLNAPLETLLRILQCTKDGLTDADALSRRRLWGSNETATHGVGILSLLLSSLRNPLVIVLLASAAISGFVGDAIGAAIIVVIVLLSAALNFVVTFRSQRAANRLRETVTPVATVQRDGRWLDLPRRDLVPGDVIRLSAGDRVPADARLLTARDVHVQQAALTGESMPVEKEAVDVSDADQAATNHPGAVFLGTSVVAGTATALVVATGRATMFGDIADSLSSRPPPTEFEIGLGKFSQLILRTVVALVLLVLLACVVLGRPPLESMLFAVSLAVGLTPEFMPMIATATLARGALRMSRRAVIVKHLAAIDDFGSMDVLLSDKTGTLTTGDMRVDCTLDANGKRSDDVLRLAAINSRLQTGLRSPLDAAIIAAAGEKEPSQKLDELPFDFTRRRLSVIVAENDSALLVTKGAPEFVLSACTAIECDGAAVMLDDTARARCDAIVAPLCERGLRVLAVAYRRIEQRARYELGDEEQLVLAGFVAFEDPPVAEAAVALQRLADDGVRVKILTGDDERVARHVCERVGIDPGTIILGRDIDALSDVALGALAERTTIFARVLPAQKHRIVLALKSRGHVVGFLGDGINDAPSLHAANVGISVMNAVDVAKDAADIVLRERHLDVLHEGVIEGRRAFANVMKYLLMGTSSNFGNMFSMAAGVLFLPFLPMLPRQILLNNFLYDLAQVSLPGDRVDAAQVRRPQRWNIEVIRRFMLRIGPISSLYDFLTFFVLLKVMNASAESFHTGWFVESIATQIFVLFVIRTRGNPLRSRPSGALVASTIAVVALAVLLPYSPWAAALGFVPLPWPFFAFLAGATATYLLLVEAAKRAVFGAVAD